MTSLTAEAWFRYQAIAREICGGQSDNGTGFSPTTSSLLVYIVPPVLHSRLNLYVYLGTGHEGPELGGEWRYSTTLSVTSALDGGVWSKPRYHRLTPRKENRLPLHRRLSGPQDPSERVRENLAFTEVRSSDLPIFTYMLLLSEGQWVKAWRPSKDAKLFRTSEEHWIEKYCHVDF
jgi:hypothetical protein